MRIKKENIMPIVVLVAISVIVAALLGVVNMLTASRIADNKQKEVQASLFEVLPDADVFEKVDLSKIENVPATVKEAYSDKGGSGYVVVLETSTSYTSGDKMSISVGVSKDLKIAGIKINAYSETKDFGQKSHPKKFIGLGSEDVNLADDELLVTGVTYSSKAFKSAVKDALNLATILGGGTVEITVADRVAILAKGAVEIALPAGAPEAIKAMYSVKGAYVFHAVNDNAEIVVKIVNGQNAGIDIVKDTEGNLEKSSAVKALITDATAAYGARISEMAEMIGSATVVEIDVPSLPDTVRRLFIGEGGYVAETLTSTQYVERETQALVAVSRAGEILGVKLLNWTVGHDVYPAEGYTDSYVGKTETTVDGVELVSGATGTAAHLRDSVKVVVAYINASVKVANDLLGATDATEVMIDSAAPQEVRRVFVSSYGVVVETVTSTQYVAAETYARTALDHSGKVISVSLISWVVGHNVYPAENYTDTYIGRDFVTVEGVELVSGATGTAEHLRDAVKAALAYCTSSESKAAVLLGAQSVEKIDISAVKPEGSPVVAVYTANGKYVAEIKTSTQYVANETYSFVVIDSALAVEKLELITWTVGHGVYPESNYTDNYVGKTETTVDGVELVSGATGTAEHLRDAVKAAIIIVKEVV